MKAFLLGAVTLASLPTQSQGVWWWLSNGPTSGFEPKQALDMQTKLGREMNMLALNKFEFRKDGTYDFNLTVSLQNVYNAGHADDSIWEAYNNSGYDMFKLTVCSSESFQKLYQRDQQMPGTLCDSGLVDLCQQFPLLLDNAEGVSAPSWSVRTYQRYVKAEDTLYFILNGCSFSTSALVSAVEGQVSGRFSFMNGKHYLSATELQLIDYSMVLCSIFLSLALLWYAHCWWWSANVDVTLQLGMGIVISLKAGLTSMTVLVLYFKGMNDGSIGAAALYYVSLLSTSVYILAFMYGTFLLANGYRTLAHTFDQTYSNKVLRLAAFFGLIAGCFILAERSNVLLWILALFLYIFLTSSINQGASTSLRYVSRQLRSNQAELDGARLLDMQAEVRVLERRQRFLRKSATMFTVVRAIALFYFCIFPVILMVMQMLILRAGYSTGHSILVPVDESMDLIFIIAMGYTFRARSLDKYIIDENRRSEAAGSADDGQHSQSQDSDFESATNVDIEMQSQRARTVVVPMSSQHLGVTPAKPVPHKPPAHSAPVITVSNFGEREQEVNLGIAQKYAAEK